MAQDTKLSEPLALQAYSSFADRYSAIAPTKPHNALYERPATLGLLGDVAGLRVLDAGCGPGIGSAILAHGGAAVHAFDVVPEMIALARQRCSGLAVDFMLADLAAPLDWLEGSSFDRVLCSLALDYIEDLEPVFREFHRVTKPGGAIVFSTSHPMFDWMREDIRRDSVYYERSRYGLHWRGFGEPYPFIESYRRPISQILNALADAGWTFDRMEEPRPLPEMKEVAERTYHELSRSPAFMCIRART